MVISQKFHTAILLCTCKLQQQVLFILKERGMDMNKKTKSIISGMFAAWFLATMAFGLSAYATVSDNQNNAAPTTVQSTKSRPPKQADSKSQGNSQYSIDQAISDKAQLSTIAFSGLAFITGSAGADTFFPPGKVADFFGFQYMRDVDQNGYGHNTTFLTKAANNVLYILTDEQKAQLTALAKEQTQVYTDFAYNRFLLMNAFRRNLEGKGPTSAKGLSESAVMECTANLYSLDADLSYRRAVVMGNIISSFTDEQKAYLDKMSFNNSATWPDITEEPIDKQSMSPTAHTAVMTYASELFSWYKGSLDADVYFCPERHGTYFGGFYMKDYPAMGNPNYFISTSITGDSGEGFLNMLTTSQRQLITEIVTLQSKDLKEIVSTRRQVATELRKAMTGGTVDKTKVYALIKRYGQLDGQMSYYYATRFAQVNKTLTASQRATLVKLRNLTVYPEGAYFFSTPIKMPTLPSTDFLFGVGKVPTTTLTAPSTFAASAAAGNQEGKAPKPGNGTQPPPPRQENSNTETL